MGEIFIGLISGIVGGLGLGGGTFLILFLSVFFNVEQHIAQATNIIFFVPTAISAILISLKNKNIDLKARNSYMHLGSYRSFYRSSYFK